MKLSVLLPVKTVSALNVREHWAVKSKRNAQTRKTVALALAALGPDERKFWRKVVEEAGCEVLLTRRWPPRGRELDDDNVRGALKAVRDEIAAWLGVDDGSRRISWGYAQEAGGPDVIAEFSP